MRILPIKIPGAHGTYHTKYAFQVHEKLDNGAIAWTTVATLQKHYYDYKKHYLYFYKLGKENEEYNGNECIEIDIKDREGHYELLERVALFVRFKMLEMANGIIKELSTVEFAEEEE